MFTDQVAINEMWDKDYLRVGQCGTCNEGIESFQILISLDLGFKIVDFQRAKKEIFYMEYICLFF